MAFTLQAVVAVSFCWFVTSSIAVFPHSISYFNEFAEGPLNGSRHLLGSNLDWGQDLRYLDWWLDEFQHTGGDEAVHLAYYGGFDPAAVGFSDVAATDPSQFQDPQLKGWFVVSANLVEGLPFRTRDGRGQSIRRLEYDSLKRFRSMKALDRVGYSILVYRLN